MMSLRALMVTVAIPASLGWVVMTNPAVWWRLHELLTSIAAPMPSPF